MTTDPDEPGADYQSRATGYALAGVGAVCVLAGFAGPFFIDVHAPDSPAIGVGGLRGGGILFIIIGAFMVLSGSNGDDG